MMSKLFCPIGEGGKLALPQDFTFVGIETIQ